MATRSHLPRLIRTTVRAFASHSAAGAASSGASLHQCRTCAQRLGGRFGVADTFPGGGEPVMQRRFSRVGVHNNAGGVVSRRREFGPGGDEDDEGLLEDGGEYSDAGNGSRMDENEWEEGHEEEGELGSEDELGSEGEPETLEADMEPPEPRKSNGRKPDYSMRIEAPIDEIYALLHSRGFITVKQKRPTPNDSVLGQEDHRIVSWYRRVSVGLLNYYSCCDNFLKVKAIVNYQLRWSAIHTLSKKHKSSSRQVILKYGKNLVVTRNGKTVASFLSVEEIKKHRKGFLEIDPVPPETLIDVLYTRMKRRSRMEKKQT